MREREERFRMSLSALHGLVYDLDLRTHKAERHGLQRILGYEKLGRHGRVRWLDIDRASR